MNHLKKPALTGAGFLSLARAEIASLADARAELEVGWACRTEWLHLSPIISHQFADASKMM